ncbi:MAG: transposase [Spirochaetaceae bacterium]|nr:transposase [Spirochaetaceae bacterium]
MNRKVKITRDNKEIEVDISSLTNDEFIQVLENLENQFSETTSPQKENFHRNNETNIDYSYTDIKKLKSNMLKIDVENKDLIEVENNLNKIIRNYGRTIDLLDILKFAINSKKYKELYQIPEGLYSLDIFSTESNDLNHLILSKCNDIIDNLKNKQNLIISNKKEIRIILDNNLQQIDESYLGNSGKSDLDFNNEYLSLIQSLPKKFLKNSIITNNLLAAIVVDKYFYGTVDHQIKLDFNIIGINLGDLNKHFEKVANLLRPLSQEILNELLENESLVLTESRFNTLDDRTAKGWLLSLTSPLNQENKVYYMYNKNLSSKTFRDKIKSYTGKIQADWARDYLISDNNYNISISFSYLRNIFEEELHKNEASKDNYEIKITINKILRAIDRIIYIDKCGRILLENNKISAKEFLSSRAIASKIQFNKLKKIIKSRREIHLYNTQLVIKFDFVIQNFELILNYLDNVELTPYKSGVSNYVMMYNLEKLNNFYVESDNDAELFSIIFSVLQSANANNIDMIKYVSYLLTTIDQSTYNSTDYKKLLPWNLESNLKNRFVVKEVSRKANKLITLNS